MTERQLVYQMRRGLGGAIMELKREPNNPMYAKIVLRCCLKDMSYDIQSEGSKGKYLYSAIKALGTPDFFEDTLIARLLQRIPDRLSQQLTDILTEYVWDGSEKAAMAMETKYADLLVRLPGSTIFPRRYGEREQLEYLMITFADLDGWSGFKRCVDDLGAMILAHGSDDCVSYAWFLSHCEGMFGEKRVWQYLNRESERSPRTDAFVSAFNAMETNRQAYQQNLATPTGTLDAYTEHAKVQSRQPYVYAHMARVIRLFVSAASKEDIKTLANRALNEKDVPAQAWMLRAFSRIDFPLDATLLFPLLTTQHPLLKEVATDALERLKDPRIHDLAITLLGNGDVETGLALLRENWRKGDDTMIQDALLRKRTVTHAAQMHIGAIYYRHRSKTCGKILEHVHRNGPCSCCREEIVANMMKNKVITADILQECRYDSNGEIRKLARRYLAKSG